jgi:hypothetical protein
VKLPIRSLCAASALVIALAIFLPATAMASGNRVAHPRVQCGGGDDTVTWTQTNISVSGDVWDTCGAGTYVQIFLNYCDLNGCTNGIRLQTAGPRSNVSLSFSTGQGNVDRPGGISLTACRHNGNWQCGADYGV